MLSDSSLWYACPSRACIPFPCGYDEDVARQTRPEAGGGITLTPSVFMLYRVRSSFRPPMYFACLYVRPNTSKHIIKLELLEREKRDLIIDVQERVRVQNVSQVMPM